MSNRNTRRRARTNYDKREELEEKAAEFLGCEYLQPFYPDEPGGKNYAARLAEFKRLLASGDAVLRTAAWNNVVIREPDKVRAGDFTPEEYDFIRLRGECASKKCARNPSPRIVTERLILSPSFTDDDRATLIGHIRDDGDIENYASTTRDHFANGVLLPMGQPYSFAIREKSSGRTVGMIGFDEVDDARGMANVSWYVIRPCRRTGYAKEAALALTRAMFEGRLCENVDTLKYDVYRRYHPKIDLIRAEIHADNAPSRRLAESCGFALEFVDRRFYVVKGSGRVVDGAIYYLTPDALAAAR